MGTCKEESTPYLSSLFIRAVYMHAPVANTFLLGLDDPLKLKASFKGNRMRTESWNESKLNNVNFLIKIFCKICDELTRNKVNVKYKNLFEQLNLNFFI